MTDFSFLEGLELTEVQASATRGGKKANPNPDNADIRVFATGEVYPSLALTEEFQLEYQPEGSAEVENGLDLIDSNQWDMLPDGVPQFLAVAIVSKGEARKPHLFGKSRKGEDGTPIHSVNDQGSTASGKALIAALEATLGFEFAEGQSFVDLDIDREHLLASPNGIYNLPRVQMKGEKAGTLTFVRRENCDIYPMTIHGQVETQETAEEPAEEEIELPIEEEEVQE